uniref:Cyclin-dependent kinase inhibitor 1C (p57, Kip2) n=1 Tax=Iconisemion striatum TaxID=60296 RepID=A0A1A7WPY1_9TELE
MSHVQLSSSALERLVARRTFPLYRRTGVCRNLFGPVDHDELSRDMKAKLREISERDQQRWNFNFDANTPLAGDYEWEEVPVEKTPAFYLGSAQQSSRSREPPTPVKRRPSSDSDVPETETPAGDVMERLVAPGSSAAPGPVETNQENRAVKLNSGSPRQVPCVRRKRTSAADNTHITDFFVKRKRAADMISSDTCHLSKSPVPLEQTPRKRIR